MDRRQAHGGATERCWAGWAIGPLAASSGRLGVDAPPPEQIPPITLLLTPGGMEDHRARNSQK
eukprot:3346347-Pyramimonas_sp.AAC.1